MTVRSACRTLRIVFVLACGLSTAPAGAAGVMVVKASGPSRALFPVGRVIRSGTPVTLRDGDALTVLDGGGTRVVSGPARLADLVAEPLPAADASLIGRMLKASGERRNVIAGTREVTLTDAAPAATTGRDANIWTVHWDGGGTWCAAEGEVVSFARDDIGETIDLTITQDGVGLATLAWAEGRARLDWAPAPGTTAGARLAVRGSKPSTTSVDLHVIPSEPEDAVTLARTLYGNQCYAQFDVLAGLLL